MSSDVIPMPKIHETAIIHPNAVLGKNVEIGPYAVIDEEVVIGDNCKIGAHAVIHKYTTVGKNCKFFPGCSIGADPQDLKFEDEETSTVIGDGCVFRECTTVNRATGEGNKTIIGNNILMMAIRMSHIIALLVIMLLCPMLQHLPDMLLLKTGLLSADYQQCISFARSAVML